MSLPSLPADDEEVLLEEESGQTDCDGHQRSN